MIALSHKVIPQHRTGERMKLTVCALSMSSFRVDSLISQDVHSSSTKYPLSGEYIYALELARTENLNIKHWRHRLGLRTITHIKPPRTLLPNFPPGSKDTIPPLLYRYFALTIPLCYARTPVQRFVFALHFAVAALVARLRSLV